MLSVHFWYWNNRENTERRGPKLPEFWTEERLAQLANIAEMVENKMKNPGTSMSVRSVGFAPLLHSEWSNLYPGSKESPAQLEALIRRLETKETQPDIILPWSPKLNQSLRLLASRLIDKNEYLMSRLLEEWRSLNPGRRDGVEFILDRLDDANISPPVIDRLAKKPVRIVPRIEPVKIFAPDPPVIANCLNARGQMRWTQQAVTDLLQAHKLAVASKNKHPDTKLATILHTEFKKKYPSCPVGPNVLLTKCYIFRSEIKSGKLVMQNTGDVGSTILENISRNWSVEMLNELGPARRRAVYRKRIFQLNNQSIQLGDLWLEEFKLKFPNYKASKKQLIKKYKWWRTKQNSSMPEHFEVSGQLYLEIKGILEGKNLILPPDIPATVLQTITVQVDNSKLQEMFKKDSIKLPGGAVIMPRHEPVLQAKVEIAPDVSIYPTQDPEQIKPLVQESDIKMEIKQEIKLEEGENNNSMITNNEVELDLSKQKNDFTENSPPVVNQTVVMDPPSVSEDVSDVKLLPSASLIAKLSTLGRPTFKK